MSDLIMSNLQAILMGFALLSVGAAALFGLTRVETEDGEKSLTYNKNKATWPVVGAVVVFLLAASIAFVPRGYVGVIYDWSGGIQQDERPEGLNFMVPFKQHLTNVDVRAQSWVFNDEAVYVHTKDFHEIRVPYTIIYRVEPTEAAHVLQTVAGDPAETILGPVANRSVRNEVGLVVLDDLARNVNQISDSVLAEISRLAAPHGLQVIGFEPQDTVVRQAYIDAVERERISERDILTARNQIEIASNEAEAVRRRAAGEADAIDLLAVAQENQQTLLGMTGYEYVLFTSWNGAYPSTLVSGGAEILLGIPGE
jgi:regulator of protease activity HflC (stomatin/prohibitin superfamily)